MEKKRIYTFGNGHAEGKADMRNLLGGKGANLAEMNLIGVPVPPGFTITTEVCNEYFEKGKDDVVALLKNDVEKSIAGVLLDFHVKGFSALLHTQYVGKQYFTNGRNDALSLDDYCVTNLNLGYELAASKIGSVRFGVQINNLFNTEYCNNGYGYSSIVGGVREDSAFYFPQAMFNVLANVTVRF